MREISRFFLVGGVATLIDYAVFSSALWGNLHYSLAITLGYLIGFWFHFVASRRVVFTQGSKVEHSHMELVMVFIIAVIGLGLNILIVNVLSQKWDLVNLHIARIIAIGIVFFWGYFARKLFVYH